MKIIYLASGAAGMYCGMCLHDNTLAAAMIAAGEDVLLVPTYTPLRTDEANVSKLPPMMYGGINVYLQQLSPIFRYTPRWIEKLLDSQKLLNMVSRFAASVQAEKLGPLTVSMLKGEDGRQRKELDKLIAWLRTERPDVVHLSNAMLVGMAGPIRRALNVPIVCSLSGEDIFLEKLVPPYYEQARKIMKDKAGDVDAYTALNRYYADFMIDYMRIDPARVHVISHGLKLAGHAKRRPSEAGEPVTIGYFARVCYEKGLHLLVEAFQKLHERPGLPPLKLVAAGYLGKADRPYLAKLEQRLKERKLHDRFEYLGEPDRAGKIRILQSFDLMSVPAVYRESKGLSIIEALANGVPVVQPAHGSYPEMVEDTGGGLLFEPENVDDLTDKLERLIRDHEKRRTLGERGHSAVHARYDDRRMAEQTIALYRRLTEEHSRRRAVSEGTVVHTDATLR